MTIKNPVECWVVYGLNAARHFKTKGDAITYGASILRDYDRKPDVQKCNGTIEGCPRFLPEMNPLKVGDVVAFSDWNERRNPQTYVEIGRVRKVTPAKYSVMASGTGWNRVDDYGFTIVTKAEAAKLLAMQTRVKAAYRAAEKVEAEYDRFRERLEERHDRTVERHEDAVKKAALKA